MAAPAAGRRAWVAPARRSTTLDNLAPKLSISPQIFISRFAARLMLEHQSCMEAEEEEDSDTARETDRDRWRNKDDDGAALTDSLAHRPDASDEVDLRQRYDNGIIEAASSKDSRNYCHDDPIRAASR
ncbi:hypothetical protein CCMA1212_003427 [Trichoderma ghanense]|uniref:Uncharacterized protein n=1 Tax=Trichoderma ghanense TaxID=65468 RepID=A0ABY2H7T9_9HYPO